jgi:uncharacterized protein (DUF427 family)
MSEKKQASPGFAKNPGYAIALSRPTHRIRLVFNDETIADSGNVLLMQEQNHAPVCYFPQSDVAMRFLQRTDHSTHCPYKGDASYWTLSVAPYAEVAEIEGYVAFYRDRMDGWFEDGEPVLGRAHR